MAVIVETVNAFMKVTGNLVGSFEVQEGSEEEGNGIPNLNAIGRVINNIFSSCTFRPPKTASDLCQKDVLLQDLSAVVQRHRKNFNPVGGLSAAGVVILLAYSVANWVGNTFIPYIIRENYKLCTKCMAGGAMVILTKESVEGWARITNGHLQSS